MENSISKKAVIYVRSSGPKELLLYQLQDRNRVLAKTAKELGYKILGFYNEIGKSNCKHRPMLCKKRIPTPTNYFLNKYPDYYKKELKRIPSDRWNLISVQKIVQNPVYIGKIVHGRTRTKAASSKKTVKRPQNECIIAIEAHDAIISKELWDTAQNQLESRKQSVRRTGGV